MSKRKKYKSRNNPLTWIDDVIREAEKEAKKYPEWMLVGNTIEESHIKRDPDRPLFYKER